MRKHFSKSQNNNDTFLFRLIYDNTIPNENAIGFKFGKIRNDE